MFSAPLRCGVAFVLAALLALSAGVRAADDGSAPPAPAGGAPERIVSLLPSMTEDLFAIGAGAEVVAVSSYTDYPPEATDRPVVSTFTSVDAERVRALHPTIVVGAAFQRPMTRDLERLGVHVVLLDDESYDGIFTTIERLGALSHHDAAAAGLVASLRRRAGAIASGIVARYGSAEASKPRAFLVLNVDPIVTAGAGSYLASLLRLAGMRDAAASLPTSYGPFGAEALVAADPDALVSDPQVGLDAALGRAPWNTLRAVREKHVFVIRDVALLERPGPRFVEGLAWLAHVRETLP